MIRLRYLCLVSSFFLREVELCTEVVISFNELMSELVKPIDSWATFSALRQGLVTDLTALVLRVEFVSFIENAKLFPLLLLLDEFALV